MKTKGRKSVYRDKILACHKENPGWTHAQIAKAVGCHIRTVDYNLSDKYRVSLQASNLRYAKTSKGIAARDRAQYKTCDCGNRMRNASKRCRACYLRNPDSGPDLFQRDRVRRSRPRLVLNLFPPGGLTTTGKQRTLTQVSTTQGGAGERKRDHGNRNRYHRDASSAP
jgi:hypothetical protein